MRIRLTLGVERANKSDTRQTTPGDEPALSDRISADQERITSALISLAQTQVAATLSNADSHDIKALSLLATDIAGVALLLTNRADLNRFWWAALIPAVLSALGFAWTLLPRDFSTGPAIDELYEDTIEGPALTAKVALLDALTQAIEKNRHTSDRKRLGWAVGGIVMAASAVPCAIYLLVVR